MGKTNYFIGVDISSDYFTISVIKSPKHILVQGIEFSNDLTGFKKFQKTLLKQSIKNDNSIICMECTGVYSEKICYYLFNQGFSIVSEQPLKVKRAFSINEHKTDSIDSLQIAEYIFRFIDKVKIWQPREDLLEKINTILNTRDLFVEQKVATQNHLGAISKKEIIAKQSVRVLRKSVRELKKNIDVLETEMIYLINSNQELKNKFNILKSGPGVGLFLALRLLVKTNGFTMDVNYKHLASNIGICPFRNQSGTSINKKSKSKGVGDEAIRKLLHLASWSVIEHKKKFRHYYQRKIEEGKPKRLVLNNVANKLLKILFAMIRNGVEYIPTYRSVNPNY